MAHVRTVGLIVVLLTALAAPVDADDVLAVDNIWSWWVHPISSHADGVTWVGGISSNGTVQVTRLPDGGEPEKVVLASQEADEHNAAAVLARPETSTVAAWTEHNADDTIHYVRETAVGSGQFGDVRSIRMPGKTTYVQLAEAGGRLWMVTRVDSTGWWLMRDDGDGWTEPTLLMDSSGYGMSYMIVKPASYGDLLRVAVYGHPTSSDWHDIEYGYIRTGTGQVVTPGGNVVANLDGTNLPLRPGDLQGAVVPQEGGGWLTRLLDLEEIDGVPAVTYAVWHPNDHSFVRYRVARWNGSGWSKFTLREAGAVFGYLEEVHYQGGAVIGGDSVVTAWESDGVWAVERFAWNGGGFDGHGPGAESADRLVRPYVAAGGDLVVYQRLHRYDGYTDYEADTVVF